VRGGEMVDAVATSDGLIEWLFVGKVGAHDLDTRRGETCRISSGPDECANIESFAR
jgi:hypothetical protein